MSLFYWNHDGMSHHYDTIAGVSSIEWRIVQYHLFAQPRTEYSYNNSTALNVIIKETDSSTARDLLAARCTSSLNGWEGSTLQAGCGKGGVFFD